jgi:hypothetical protein
MDAVSDAELLGKHAREDATEALGELAERHGGVVCGTCLRIVSDPHLAEPSSAVYTTLTTWAYPCTENGFCYN